MPLARDIMTRPVVTVRPDDHIRDAYKLMLERHIGALPVVDENQRVVGILSDGDIVRAIRSQVHVYDFLFELYVDEDQQNPSQRWEEFQSLPIREVMVRPVVTVTPDTPLSRVTETLIRRRVKRVPVIEDGHLLGIVCRGDILRGLEQFWDGVSGQSADQR